MNSIGCLALVSMLAAACPAAENLRITTCAELARTIADRDTRRHPFCVTGLVLQTIHSTKPCEIDLQDVTGAVKIKGQRPTDILPGDLIVVSGRTDALTYGAVCPEYRYVQKIGHKPPPPPTAISAQDLIAGRFDWRLVRLRGRVQQIQPSELSGKWVFLTLNCDNVPVLASSPCGDDAWHRFSSLIGATVDLVGVVTPHDGSRRLRIGRILHFADIESLHVVIPPPKDPFDVPDIQSTYDLAPSEVAALGQRVARGRIIARWGGDKALLRLQDGSTVKVKFSKAPDIRVGDFIDALGLPESDLQHVNLVAATLRPARPFPCEEPPVLDGRQVLGRIHTTMRHVFELHSNPIRLSGTVCALPSGQSPNQTFHLDIDGDLVTIDTSSAATVLRDLQVGMRVELTGVCVMSIENWRPRLALPQVDGFFVVLRSPEDIRILARPSWWTPQRLTMLVVALLAVLVGILIWNAALRRLAARKGRELFHEQLGHVKADLRTEERTRLAVELHDTLAQNLTGVSLEIDTAAKVADEDPIALKAHLGAAARALKSSRDELRNCLWDLRNRALETTTMDEAIRQTLAPHVAGIDVTIRFAVSREQISDNTAHAILRIIRELTLNGIRHGSATKIWIAGSIDGERMHFSVRDNGCGFDPDKAPGFSDGHYGILGIQERVDEFEGEFTLKSSSGKGTKATISLKVPQEA